MLHPGEQGVCSKHGIYDEFCGECVTEKKKKLYWYEFYYQECVLCCKTKTYKERRYTPKPKDYSMRHHFKQNACSSHFL